MIIQKTQLRGAEVFASQLANRLEANGHACKVVALFEGHARLPYQGEVTVLNGAGERRLIDITGWRKLAAIVRNWKPDVVQANAGDTLKYAVFSKKVFGWSAPIVFRNASTVSNYIKSTPARLFNGFLYRAVAAVASVSEYTRKDLIALFPVLANKAEVIPVGVDRVSLPARKIHDGRGPVLLHVGGFTFEKNHAGLIGIFRRVLEQMPNAQLWLVGDGPLRPDIEAKVVEAGLSSSVRFLGYRTDTLSFLRDADVLILPSILEGLPAVILEAFYCETPVVAYSVGGISEVVRSGETGYLVAKNDAETFVRAVVSVLRDPASAAPLVSRGHELILKHYDNAEIAVRFEDLYGKLSKH